MRIQGWLRVVIVVVAGLLGLGSCGGGGGSGFRVSFDVADVSFRYPEGESPGFRIVAATAHGNPPASGLFVGAIVSGEGIEQPINITLDEEASKAYASIAPMYGLAPPSEGKGRGFESRRARHFAVSSEGRGRGFESRLARHFAAAVCCAPRAQTRPYTPLFTG